MWNGVGGSTNVYGALWPRYRPSDFRKYLVYATRNDDTGELSTGICSRTRPMDDAAADLEYARAIRAGAPLLGRISGSVMRRDDSFAGMRSRAPEPLPDVTIRFEQDGVVMARATTDAYGGFSVSGLAAGKYRVVHELPDAYYSTVFPEQVTLILTNPPLGWRVGSDAPIGPLYEAFLANAARRLVRGGRLVWISAAPALTRSIAARHGLGLRDEWPIEMGCLDTAIQLFVA